MDGAATAISKLLSSAKGSSETAHEPAPSDSTPASAAISKDGTKDTTVDKEIKPAVTNEHVTKTHEERVQNVVEKERHQDHYQTTVQPLTDREVQPEVHDYQMAAQKQKNIDKDDGKVAADAKAREAAFTGTKDERATQETKVQEATIEGEHVHHHVHETIQPVIEKEVIKPSVTHTTVPIKENIHEKTVDHGIVQKEPMSVEEFKKAGHSVDKAEAVHKEHAGTPKVNASKD